MSTYFNMYKPRAEEFLFNPGVIVMFHVSYTSGLIVSARYNINNVFANGLRGHGFSSDPVSFTYKT